jgi:hypothetical protein
MDLRNQYSPQSKGFGEYRFKVHKNSYWPQQKTVIVYNIVLRGKLPDDHFSFQ